MEQDNRNPSSLEDSGRHSLINSQQTVQSGSTAVCPTFQNITGPLNVTLQTTDSRFSERPQSGVADVARLIDNHRKVLTEKVEYIVEYASKPGEKVLLTEKFTNLWITDGECGVVPRRHEVMDIEAMSRQATSDSPSIDYTEIFSCSRRLGKPPRVTLTKGLAGIGKTVCVHRFVHAWASHSAALDFDFLFLLPFRELNLLARNKLSVSQLVQRYYPHIEEAVAILKNPQFKCLFIFDGLDESHLRLDFGKCPEYGDVGHRTQLGVLLVNLIKGNLLPHASVWITSRPAAARRIPAPYVDRMTEIHGFRDQEKEEYFRKKCKGRAEAVLADVKRQPSLFTMCYVPAFCWILATVLEHTLKASSLTDARLQAPKTITEVYSNFLIVMIIYHQDQRGRGMNEREKISDLLRAKRPAILSLGRLAFHCLKAQKLAFYPKDLESFGVDLSLLCDSFCKEILLEEGPIFQQKAYVFMHLTLQEYLAALYVFLLHHLGHTPNLLAKGLVKKMRGLFSRPTFFDVCRSACKKAAWSQNGHLDLFLRFLCGLSTQKNMQLLWGLTEEGAGGEENAARTAAYIKKTLHQAIAPERCLNLLYCLNELNDGCIAEKVKESLREGALATRDLQPTEYSAIAYVLQTSSCDMQEFDITDYTFTDDVIWRLLPIAKLFRTIKLVRKDVTNHLVNFLKGLLTLSRSQVQELRLEDTEVSDTAMKQLCTALKNPDCKLQKISLSGTYFAQKSWEDLTAVIKKKYTISTLDLSYTFPDHSAISSLAAALKDPECRLQTLILVNNDLDVRCCEELASGLSENQRLVELNLSHNQLKDLEVRPLCRALEEPKCKLQKLNLSHNKIGSSSCQALVPVLTRNQALAALSLTNNKLGNAGVKVLCGALRSQECKLQKLSLRHNSLTYDCCQELAFVIQENSGLLELDIGANRITDSGVAVLCQVPKNNNSKIQCLRISLNDLSARCCQDLASLLVEQPTINELHLTFNVLGDAGVKYLCWAFRTRHTGMETLRPGVYVGERLHPNCDIFNNAASVMGTADTLLLNLKRNYLTDECCGDLVSSLCVMKTLRFLDLSFNGFTDSSLEYFSHLVLNCADLEEIVLRANCFSPQGCKELEQLMNSRSNLQIITECNQTELKKFPIEKDWLLWPVNPALVC